MKVKNTLVLSVATLLIVGCVGLVQAVCEVKPVVQSDERCGCNKPKPSRDLPESSTDAVAQSDERCGCSSKTRKDMPESATDAIAQDDERCGCNKPRPSRVAMMADKVEQDRCGCGCSRDCCDKSDERCGCSSKTRKDMPESATDAVAQNDERCGCTKTARDVLDQAIAVAAGKAVVGSCCK